MTAPPPEPGPRSRTGGTPPSERATALLGKGARPLAAAVVALAVATAVAAATVGSDQRPTPLLLTGGVLLALGAWREARLGTLVARGAVPAGIAGTSAIVAGAVLVALGVRAALDPVGPSLDRFLVAAGVVFLLLGVVLDERRLTGLGIVQWALAATTPAPGTTFEHCTVAGLSLPVANLDVLLVLTAVATAVGRVVRRPNGWGAAAARGVEATGLALLHGALLAKAVELPGLEILCGAGDAWDGGWAWIGIAVGVATGVDGLRRGDVLWAGAGAAAVAAQGLAGTALTASPLWAGAALTPLLAALLTADRAGIRWRRPGDGA